MEEVVDVVALRNDPAPQRFPVRTGPPIRRPALVIVTANDVPPPRVRVDALPEYTDYRDNGCELSESCLRCPLARCKYDEPGGMRKLAATARDREIALLRRKHRAPIMLLARTYGLSRRSIFRILSEQRA